MHTNYLLLCEYYTIMIGLGNSESESLPQAASCLLAQAGVIILLTRLFSRVGSLFPTWEALFGNVKLVS